MPLTFAHPVAIIPFRRFKLPFSALVIGSITPDFNYLFLTEYKMGHTLLGQFYFCLPVGLIALFLFHSFIKKPLLSLLPDSHSQPLRNIEPVEYFSPKVLPYVILALLIGSFSHYLWDSFTHFYGFAVKGLPFLQKSTPIGRLRLYKLFQHLSTITGSLILMLLYYKWYKAHKVPAKHRRDSNRFKYLIIAEIFLVPLAFSLVKIVEFENGFLHFKSFQIFVGFVMENFVPAFGAMILLYCFAWVTYKFIKVHFLQG